MSNIDETGKLNYTDETGKLYRFKKMSPSYNILKGESWDRIFKYLGVNLLLAILANIVVLLIIFVFFDYSYSLTMFLIIVSMFVFLELTLSSYESWRGCYIREN